MQKETNKQTRTEIQTHQTHSQTTDQAAQPLTTDTKTHTAHHSHNNHSNLSFLSTLALCSGWELFLGKSPHEPERFLACCLVWLGTTAPEFSIRSIVCDFWPSTFVPIAVAVTEPMSDISDVTDALHPGESFSRDEESCEERWARELSLPSSCRISSSFLRRCSCSKRSKRSSCTSQRSWEVSLVLDLNNKVYHGKLVHSWNLRTIIIKVYHGILFILDLNSN